MKKNMIKRFAVACLSLVMTVGMCGTAISYATETTETTEPSANTETTAPAEEQQQGELNVNSDAGNDEGTSDVKNIEKLTIQWINETGTTLSDYKGTEAGLNTAVAERPEGESSGTYAKNYKYEINFTLSGTYAHAKDSIQLRVPASIFAKRSGGAADTYVEWPILSAAQVKAGKKSDSPLYYWLDTETNEYVISNYQEVAGGFSASLQMMIRVQDPYQVKDNIRPETGGTTVDAAKYPEYAEQTDGKSEPLSATLQLLDNNGSVVKEESTNKIYAQLDTRAHLDIVSKYGNLYYVWNSKWGTKPAGDGDDYVYVVWSYGTSVDIASQPYDMTYTDDATHMSVTDKDGKEKSYKGEIVGCAQYKDAMNPPSSYAGSTTFTDSNGAALYSSISDLPAMTNSISYRKDGIKYNNEFILVKYKKSELDSQDVLKNTVDGTLTGIDDQRAQTQSSTATLTYSKPETFTVPPGEESTNKSASTDCYGVNRIAQGDSVTLDSYFYNYYSMTGMRYTAADGINVNDESYVPDINDFGQNYYRMTLTDDMMFLTAGDDKESPQTYYNYKKVSEDTRLQAGDYSITKAKVNYALENQAYNELTGKYYTKDETDYANVKEAAANVYIKVYDGKTSSVDDLAWEKLGTMKRTGSSSYTFEAAAKYAGKVSASGETITLPDNVVAVKMQYDSYHYWTQLSLLFPSGSVRLNATDHVKTLAAREGVDVSELNDDTIYDYLAVANVNTCTTQDKNGNYLQKSGYNVRNDASGYPFNTYTGNRDKNVYGFSGASNGIKHYAAYTRIDKYYKDSTKSKSLKKTTLDNVNQQMILSYQVAGNEWMQAEQGTSLTELEEKGAFKPTNTGTFYDLLPPGVEPDPSSVKVYRIYTSNVLLQVTGTKTVRNWRDTGRTMFIVHWKSDDDNVVKSDITIGTAAAEYRSGAYMNFNATYSWEAMKDYGTDLKNVFAYETGNNSIANGSADDGDTTAFTDIEKSAFDDVNNDGKHDHRYLYGYAQNTITGTVTADLNLCKKVRGPDNKNYTYGNNDSVVVPAGGDYSYRIRIGSSSDTNTKNLIFYDSLENYKPEASEEGYEGATWQGTLHSIDTTSAKQKGAAPVIYYSTVKNLDIEKNYPLDSTIDGEKVWVKADEYTGSLDNVRAFAVDLRYKEDGSPFVLGEKQSLNVVVNMKAPTENVQELVEEDAHAYNDIYAYSNISNAATGGAINEGLTHQHYTQVLLRTPDLKISKKSDPDTGTEESPAELVKGDKLTYTVTVKSEEASQDYQNVVAVDQVPAGLTVDTDNIKVYTGSDPDDAQLISDSKIYQLEASGNSLTFKIKNMSADSSVHFIIPTTVNKAGRTFANTPEITKIDDRDYTIKGNTTYHKSVSGSLTIEKKVKGAKNTADPSFSFQVTRDGKGVDGTYTVSGTGAPSGTQTMTDGVVTLKAGQKAVLDGLEPADNYKVVETSDITGYTTKNTVTEASGTTRDNDGKDTGAVTIVKEKTTDVVFTNTFESTNVPVCKVWDDQDDRDCLRTEEVTVHLLADGKDTGDKLILCEDNGWSATWTNLAKYNSDGEAIEYTVSEEPVKGYTTKITGNASNGYKVTNTHTPEKISVPVSKVWDDCDSEDRPEEVIVHLYANGEAIEDPLTLCADNSWAASWTNLYKNDEYGEAIDYTVSEDKVDGYSTDITGSTSQGYTVTNKGKGDLKVTKTVTGRRGDRNKEFSFTVTLGDKEINGTYGDMTFTDGVATFTLKDGETATAMGLPNRTTYEVTEENYSAEDYDTSSLNAVGTIKANETAEVEFINKLDRVSAKGSLTISKTLAGNDRDTEKEFEFTITLDDDGIEGEYSGVTFTKGVATIRLRGGESRTIEGLPLKTQYTVVEKDYSDEGYVVTKTGDTGVIGTESDTTPAAFTNTRDTYGDLTVSKTVGGNAGDKNKEFSFTVTLADTGINGEYGDMTFTDGIANFTLKDGETATATGLPNGLDYTVAEADYSDDGYATEKTGDTGTIKGNETAKADFINTKNVNPDDPLHGDHSCKTGDNTHLAMLFTIMGLAAAAIVAVLISGRRRRS